MQRAEHKNISIRGVNVRYVQAGQGPVVLLVHGLGASLITWCRNIDPLAEAGFTVLAPDLPGHGDSDKPGHLSYDPVSGARLVNEFISALGVDRVSLVGNSAGGLIVGLMALDYPEKVDRLVLVASGGLGKRVSWFLRLVSLPMLGDLLYQPWLHRNLGVAKRIFYRPPPFLDEVLLEMHRVRSLPGSRRAALRSIRSSINYFGLCSQSYIVDRLKKSTVPLMTVWGEKDIVIPLSQAEIIRRELPHSVVHTIPDCGHWPHMEKADEFNSIVTEFLRGAPVGGSGTSVALSLGK